LPRGKGGEKKKRKGQIRGGGSEKKDSLDIGEGFFIGGIIFNGEEKRLWRLKKKKKTSDAPQKKRTGRTSDLPLKKDDLRGWDNNWGGGGPKKVVDWGYDWRKSLA